MTEKERTKIVTEFNSGNINKNEFLSNLYSLRYIVTKLRRGIDARVLADCCALPFDVFEFKLNLLGYDLNGNLLHKECQQIIDTKSSTLSDDILAQIKTLMKNRVDVPEILEELNLDKTPEFYKAAANIRREIKEESETLYKTSNLQKEDSPFTTMFKL